MALIEEKEKKFALLGENISYSLSPKIHKIIFDSLDIRASYDLISSSLADIPRVVEKLKNEYSGFNVTKPYKQTIIPYLENRGEIEKSGVDAVNTVCVLGGLLYGYNTDIFGFSKALAGWNFSSALIVGAGGVANAVADSLVKMGKDVFITNRTPERADSLAEKFGIKSIKISLLAGHFFDLVVNCTSVGNFGEMSLPEGVNLAKTRYAYDTVYSPPKTAFLRLCESKNIEIRNGLSMLVYQAIKADEYMLGLRLDYEKLFSEICLELEKN